MDRRRGFLERLYVGVWLFRLPGWVGAFNLWLLRRVYPLFTLGLRPSAWGRVHMMLLGDGRVTIGDDVHMVSWTERSAITLFAPCSFTAYQGAHIVIGNKVALNGTTLTSKKRIEIGDGTMIAPNVIIVDSDFHAQWPPDQRMVSSTADADRAVVIGRNVWVGMNTVILKGTTIGDNTIIGACSLVSGAIPANVVAGGNPARVLRSLADHNAEQAAAVSKESGS